MGLLDRSTEFETMKYVGDARIRDRNRYKFCCGREESQMERKTKNKQSNKRSIDRESKRTQHSRHDEGLPPLRGYSRGKWTDDNGDTGMWAGRRRKSSERHSSDVHMVKEHTKEWMNEYTSVQTQRLLARFVSHVLESNDTRSQESGKWPRHYIACKQLINLMSCAGWLQLRRVGQSCQKEQERWD